MTDAQVQVIIPAYNAAATLRRAAESLRAQTFDAWEAVIVDDGSTDGTGELAGELATEDRRFKVIRQENAGESGARNAGLPFLSSRWLLFLDADDSLLPPHLERMISAADATGGDVIHCGWFRVTPEGRRGDPQFAPESSDLFSVLTTYNCFAVHACLVHRDLVDVVGPFDSSLKTCGDWDFWQRVARTGARFVPVSEVLACYHLTPSSPATRAKQILADGLEVIRRGHRADPRVKRPAAEHADGVSPGHAASAQLRFACWAAGLALGADGDARPLLDSLPSDRAAIPPEDVAEMLYSSVPLPAAQLLDTWPAQWPRVEQGLDAFLFKLAERMNDPEMAAQAKSLLMHKVLESSSHEANWTEALAAPRADRTPSAARQLVVCPICRSGLDQSSGNLSCIGGGHVFHQPSPSWINLMPDSFTVIEAADWETRQEECDAWYRDLVTRPFDAAALLKWEYGGVADWLNSVGGRVLDLGGGFGLARHYLRSHDAYIVLEPSIAWLSWDLEPLAAAFPCLAEPPEFVRGIGELLPFPAGSFDAAIALWSLNHVVRPEVVMRELHRVLIPGGRLILTLEDMEPRWLDLLCQRRKRLPKSAVTAKFSALLTGVPWRVQSDHIAITEAQLRDWTVGHFRRTRRAWARGFLSMELQKF